MADKKTVRDEAPPPHDEGTFAAVCVDVVDLGMHPEKFQDQPSALKDKTALVFQTENAEGADEPRYISIELTTSMGKKSNMRKFLEAWRGKAYTEEEARKQGIPLDKLEGQAGLLSVTHKTSGKGNLYALIQSIMPLPKQMRDGLPDTTKYERADFWAKKKAEYAKATLEYSQGKTKPVAAEASDDVPPDSEEDDDLPF